MRKRDRRFERKVDFKETKFSDEIGNIHKVKNKNKISISVFV